MASSSSSSAPPAQKRDYAAAIAALNSLQSNAAVIAQIRASGGKMNELALPEMQEYWRRIGYQLSDLNRLNVVHVTGTKGKGSTSAFVASLLSHAPLAPRAADAPRPRIGLYTSPHLVFVRERIRIDGVPVDEETFARYFWQVWDRLGENAERAHKATPLRPVYFRYLTLLAMHIFLSLRVSATILEVGIGGTYDSTNIVPRPLACGISSLGLDHTALLGNSVEEIAGHKAGIYKEDVEAVSVAQKESAMQVVRGAAQKAKVARFTALPPVGSSDTLRSIALGLPGAHQASNAQLALALSRSFLSTPEGQRAFPLAQPEHDLTRSLDAAPLPWETQALEQARWPGRCQRVPTTTADEQLTYFLDGAHTTDSLAHATRWFVEASSPAARRVLLFNCTHGRSAEELLEAVLAGIKDSEKKEQEQKPFFDTVVFCTNETYRHGSSGDLTSKGIDADELKALVVQRELESAWLALRPQDAAAQRVQVQPSIEDALRVVRELSSAAAQRGEETDVLVTGSLLLVGGVMAHLKGEGALDEALLSIRT